MQYPQYIILFFSEISAEIKRLNSDEGYSLTWSVEQVPYLAGPVAGGQKVYAEFRGIHQNALNDVPMFIVEIDDKRVSKSLVEMQALNHFWTVDSELMRSVEKFVREARSEVTAKALLKTSQGTSAAIPDGALLANSHQTGLVQALYQGKFEPTNFVGNIQDRRLDIKWEVSNNRWISHEDLNYELHVSNEQEIVSYLQSDDRERGGILCAKSGVHSENLEDYSAVISDHKVYILPNNEISKLIGSLSGDSSLASIIAQHVYMSATLRLLMASRNNTVILSDLADDLERVYRSVISRLPSRLIPPVDVYKKAVMSTHTKAHAFDPLSWSQRDSNDQRHGY